jgi:hypothetical protein
VTTNVRVTPAEVAAARAIAERGSAKGRATPEVISKIAEVAPGRPVALLTEGQRAALCSIWAGEGQPVSNPELMTGMHAVCWSVSEEGAVKLADEVVAMDLATGSATTGYRLTEAGHQELEA